MLGRRQQALVACTKRVLGLAQIRHDQADGIDRSLGHRSMATDTVGENLRKMCIRDRLSRGLSDADTCAAIGKMQKRTAASVMREIRGDRDALGVAYARKPIQGTVLGIDIETTGRAPERGYIINVGWEIMDLTSDAVPHDAEAHYCGLPDIYRGEDVPLSNIHHITWDDIDGKKPFRENKELQKQLLKLMKK